VGYAFWPIPIFLVDDKKDEQATNSTIQIKNMISEKQILDALSHVDDPDLHKDLVTLNMIKNIRIEGREIYFDVELTTPACPMKDMIQNACINAVQHLVDKDLSVFPNMTSRVNTSRSGAPLLPGVRNIIAVASGKGGVGKSTITVNLARSLARSGATVGILDADIYGPSIPTMLGLKGSHPTMDGSKILPLVKFGMKVLSIGFLVDEKQAIIWRGPMASSAIKQLISDVSWGDLDYLLIDLPPGTGDIHLTIVQSIPLTGAIVVTTPQEVALADCRKAIGMFNNPQINVPILGIVENMSYFKPEDKGSIYYIFGKDGGKSLSKEYQLPLLGEIPFLQEIMVETDQGLTQIDPSDNIENTYRALSGELARQVAVKNSVNNDSKELSSLT
jgi:ATP-binding protein involved in chromosome partitioning